MDGPLRVEVLYIKPDGSAKIRLCYYKWRDCAEVELKWRRGGLFGRLQEGGGIEVGHLAEIAEMLGQMGMRGARLSGMGLSFNTDFVRTAVMRGALVPNGVEPLQVEHAGGLAFKVGGRTVEFRREPVRLADGRRVFRSYSASLLFHNAGETTYAFAALWAQGVRTLSTRSSLRFNVDSLVGLMALTGAVPPGFEELYASEDFRAYAERHFGTYYYFAVKHGGVWRAAWGKLAYGIAALRAEDAPTAEAIRGKVAELLKRAGAPDGVMPSTSPRAVTLSARHLRLLFGGGASEPVKVSVRRGAVEVEVGGAKALFPLDPAGNRGSIRAIADAQHVHKIAEALLERGLLVHAGQDLKLHRSSLWPLLAMAVDGASPPVEVAPNIVFLHKISGREVVLYAFYHDLCGGGRLCFAFKSGGRWRGICSRVRLRGAMFAKAKALADAINSVYREMGVGREVRMYGDELRLGVSDLKALGVWQLLVRVVLDRLQREFLGRA